MKESPKEDPEWLRMKYCQYYVKHYECVTALNHDAYHDTLKIHYDVVMQPQNMGTIFGISFEKFQSKYFKNMCVQ